MQRSFLTNLLLMAQSICITVTTMILCPRIPEWGISAQAFSIVFWVTFYNIVLSAMVSRLIRTFRKSSESASRTEWNLRDLLISSRDSFVFMLTGRATMQSNSLILGYFVGQTDVTKLYATQRLYDVIQTQLYAVGNASWAAMAEIYHQGQGALFLKRMMQLIQLLLVMAISAVIPVLAFDQAFVTLWVGADRYGGDLLSWILAINAFALSFTVFSTWCLTGTGMLKAVLRMTIVTGIADVIATLLLTATMGRVGPVLGSCLVLCFLSVPWHLKLLSVHFGLSVKELARSNAKLVLFGMAYAAAVAALGQLMTVDTWAELVLVMGFPTVIFLAASALMLFDLEQRQMLLRRFGIQR
jgi:O-antigen/teichoic acid export membrane protein